MKKVKTGREFVYSIFIRYFLLIIAALPNFWIFYFIFTPLTVYPVYFFLNILFGATLFGNFIFIADYYPPIEIIGACVAGAAYYLLLILNLSVPNIKTKKRIKMLCFAFLSFLIVNILRIISLSVILVLKPGLFDITHKLSWYLGSIVLVVAIWFIEVKKFKIKAIPVYSDLKSISKYIK
jgi:exosortase/archaeosortase family protein